MKNPFIDLYGCMCLTLLAPQPAAAKTAGEVPPADTLRTVFFTDIHVTPGNVQDSLFRIAVAEANASDADLVIFNLTYVDEANRPLPQPDFSGFTDEILDEDGVWQRCFALAETRIYYVVAWNKLYRRSLFQHLRYAPGKRYEDQFLLPHLLAQCKTIACLAAPGYRYVQRSGSIMAQGSSRTYLDRPEYLLDWCAYFTQKGDALRAEGLLNDAIQNLAEKQCFDLSTPAQQARYRAACRACAEDLKMASLLGINTDRVIALTFVIGAAMAAVAGVLLGQFYGVINPYIGFMAGMKAFTAAVLGGIGSIPGAMIGGLILGIAEALSSAYLSTEYKDVVSFALLILVLLVMPTGILGRPEVEKV